MEFHVTALRVIFPAAERVAPQEIAAQQEFSYAAAAGFKGLPSPKIPRLHRRGLAFVVLGNPECLNSRLRLQDALRGWKRQFGPLDPPCVKNF